MEQQQVKKERGNHELESCKNPRIQKSYVFLVLQYKYLIIILYSTTKFLYLQ